MNGSRTFAYCWLITYFLAILSLFSFPVVLPETIVGAEGGEEEFIPTNWDWSFWEMPRRLSKYIRINILSELMILTNYIPRVTYKVRALRQSCQIDSELELGYSSFVSFNT